MFGDAITGIKGFFGGQTPPVPSPQQQYEARPRPPLTPPPNAPITHPLFQPAVQESPPLSARELWWQWKKARDLESKQYTIQGGDTLSQIAQRLGVSADDLARANTIQNPDMIRAGQVLNYPSTQSPPDMSHLTGVRDQNGTLTVNQLGARLYTDHPNLSKAQMQAPATLGNNNPIGILVGDSFINWNGLTQRGQDRKGHKHSMYQFITPEYGARAAARNIRTQGRAGKASTYGGFVNLLKSRDKKLGRGYDKFVADKLGVKVTDTFNYEDDQSLADFLEVFANYESGSYETKNKHVQKWPRGVIETGILMERR